MGYSLAWGWLGGKAMKPHATPLTPPPVMPDQQLVSQAAKKEAAMSIGRTGRASTLLSAGSDVGASDKLGP